MNNKVAVQYLKGIFSSLCVLFILSCSQDPGEVPLQGALPFERSDECHLCGMIITRFPGPKGQLFEQQVEGIRKFCSTRDLFAYALQPENKHRISEIYVHDMVAAPWQNPNDEHLIDAKRAWYVIGHKQKGAMGATLASFAKEKDAQKFISLHGGEVKRFADISLSLLTNLKEHGHH